MGIHKVLGTLSLAVPVGAGTARVLPVVQSRARAVAVGVVRRGRALVGLLRRTDLMGEVEVAGPGVVTGHGCTRRREQRAGSRCRGGVVPPIGPIHRG